MTTYDWYRPVTWLGGIMILIGLILVLVPFLARYVPEIEKIPPILLYVYRRDGFTFATSPILILISIIWMVMSAVSRYSR